MTKVDFQALSANMENYLEAILILMQNEPVARAKDIAERMNVNRSSVTGALQALRDRGLVNYEPYGYVTLTPTGLDAAKKVLWRHEALRTFFITILGIPEDEADDAACKMEHGISKTIVSRLVQLSDFIGNDSKAKIVWTENQGFSFASKPPR